MCPLLLLFILKCVQSSLQVDTLVETGVGYIQGLAADDGNYTMFLGIPYADVNLTNPFGAATPSANFTEVFEANNGSAICPQEKSSKFIGSLDCLKLNVYVPNEANVTNKLPVIIFIHGGTFVQGSFTKDTYGPKFLVENNVLLVTINYRLGPYGFMCLDTAEVPGNQGLKDQYLAIQWVKDNIAAFGGDENQITLAGQSAGSKSVDLHLLSQREHLFQQVIMLSGTSIGPGVVEASDNSTPATIAKQLGYDTDDMAEALEYLVNTDPLSVVAAGLDAGIKFQICVEKEFDCVERFVFEHPEFSNYSQAKDIPILAGFTNNEFIKLYNNSDSYFNTSIFSKRIQSLFDFGECQEMENLTRHFYIGDEVVNASKKLEVIDFLSDYVYDYPVQRSLVRYNENGNDNIYQYLFSYTGGRNIVKVRQNLTIGGATHADDLGYIFDPLYLKDVFTVEDQLLTDRMSTLWSNFATYGNPTPETSDLIPVTWSPITTDALHYLDIDHNLTMSYRPLRERLVFWELFFKANAANYKANLGYFD